MKVAICISGQLRTFERTFPALSKFILEPFHCDVFVSTWNDSGLPEGVSAPVALQKAADLYRPVVFDHECWTEVLKRWGDLSFLASRCRADAHADRVLGMFYKIWRSNELKKEYEKANGFVYDVVIRSRADVLYFESPEIDQIYSDMIYLGNKFGYGGLTDQFAFGPSATMDIYSSVVHRIAEYAQLGCVVHPETLLEWHLRTHLRQGVLFSRVPFRLDRGDVEPTPLVWGRTA